jgi:hypothetical protein
MEYVKQEYKIVRGACLDHSCIIQNFFSNAVLKESQASEFISHGKDPNNRSILDHEHTTLETYDDLTLIQTRFKEYLNYKADNPTLLHAHGVSNEGEPIETTWEAPIRFFSNRNIKPLSDALYETKDKGVFLTLTVDHSRTLKEAWENIAKRWNIFITRLAKELHILRKNLHYLWVLEAQGNGYPHIHALFLGIDWLFWAGNKKVWNGDNTHSKNLKHFWKWGSVYVNSTKSGSNVKDPISYMMKYIRKTWNSNPDSKAFLTQAMLWVFNKRSWNTSRNLPEYLHIEKKSSRWTLHSISKFEYLHGQSTPWIRIKKAPRVIQTFSERDKTFAPRPNEIQLWLRLKSHWQDSQNPYT